MTINLAEVKAYLETKFSFEDEKVLEETAKGLKKVIEDTVYGMTEIDDIDLLSKKKQLEEDIEKFLESNSKGKVKDYFLVLSDNKDKEELYLQGYIELK